MRLLARSLAVVVLVLALSASVGAPPFAGSGFVARVSDHKLLQGYLS